MSVVKCLILRWNLFFQLFITKFVVNLEGESMVVCYVDKTALPRDGGMGGLGVMREGDWRGMGA